MNDEISEVVKGYMKEFRVPGVAVGVVHGNEIYTDGMGVTNVDNPLTVDENTLFQIGSITKTFVGTMTMMLAERGELDLDEPICTYLPEFKVKDEEATEKATLRHIFTHTAGWVGDWFPADLGQGSDAVTKYVETMADTPQLTPVGETLSYNNAGFNLAGRILEKVTGKVFSSLIKELIFDPLGMSHTFMLPWDLMTYRFVVGHTVKDGTLNVAQPWSIGRASGPAGGVITCVKDMLNYARFQLGDGEFKGKRIIDDASLKLLHTPQVKFAPYNSVALTFWVDDRRKARTLSHGGGTVGQTSLFTIAPSHEFCIIVVTNSGSGTQLNPKVTNLALKRYIGVETPELPYIKIDEERLHSYVGEYKATLTSAEVKQENGRLLISRRSLGGFPTKDAPPSSEPSPPVPFVFYDEDHLVGLEEPNKGDIAQFIRGEDGEITWLRLGLRIHRPL